MSKKDYIKMAKQFEESVDMLIQTDDATIVYPYVSALIKDFATMLEGDNPLFKRDVFLSACHVAE